MSRERERTPALIRVGTFVSPAVGVLLIAFALFQSLGLGASKLMAWPASMPPPVYWYVTACAGGFILLLIGYGLGNGRTLARPTAILFWCLQGALAAYEWAFGMGQRFQTPFGQEARGCSCNLLWIVGLVIASWYFYGKSNVVEYYDALRRGDLNG